MRFIALAVALAGVFGAVCAVPISGPGSTPAASTASLPGPAVAAGTEALCQMGEGTDKVSGTVFFSQSATGMRVVGVLTGLPPGLHGFHVHETGDTGNNCTNAGPHFNPGRVRHGARTDLTRHAGDYGNVLAKAEGVAVIEFTDYVSTLTGRNGVTGRALVVHADRDDLGRGNTPLSLTTGNSGPRVDCCVIRLL